MDTVLADSSDHDPIFGISDGTSFVGFQAINKGNCFDIEGDVANAIFTNRVHDIIGL